jgi:HEPN domain-containing protein
VTWGKGEAEVRRLVATGALQSVSADRSAADDLVRQAKNHLESARRILDIDPEGALQLAYDAARKSLAAILENQGLRATTGGGHRAVLDAARAQLVPPLGDQMRDFDWMRRVRNHTEYRNDRGPSASRQDAEEAIDAASEIIDIPFRMLDAMTPFVV